MFLPRIGHTQDQNNSKLDSQCTYNVTLRRLRATIVVAEKR